MPFLETQNISKHECLFCDEPLFLNVARSAPAWWLVPLPAYVPRVPGLWDASAQTSRPLPLPRFVTVGASGYPDEVVAPRRRVVVVCFNRYPQEMDNALLDSELGRRAAEQGLEVQPTWANGAKIFVERITASDLEESRVELCPRHVVVWEEDEHLVDDALDQIPYKRRPRLKPPVHKVAVPSNSNVAVPSSSRVRISP